MGCSEQPVDFANPVAAPGDVGHVDRGAQAVEDLVASNDFGPVADGWLDVRWMERSVARVASALVFPQCRRPQRRTIHARLPRRRYWTEE